MKLYVFNFVFQLVQVLTYNILELVGVLMRTIMLAVALLVVTVVDLMSSLNTAQNVNVWEKISRAHLHQVLFVPAHWKM